MEQSPDGSGQSSRESTPVVDAAPAGEPGVVARVPPNAAPTLLAGPILFAVLGVIGGVLAWYVIEKNHPRFAPSPELQAKMANINAVLSPEDLQAIRVVAYSNTVFAITMWGLGVGVFAGCADGIARRSAVAPLVGAVVAGILGGLFGALGGMASQVIYEYGTRAEAELGIGIILAMHATCFVIASVGVGAGIALPLFAPKPVMECVIKAALGALAAAMIYLPAVAMLMPSANTDRTVPDGSLNRLLWCTIPAMLVGVIVGGVNPRSATPRTRA